MHIELKTAPFEPLTELARYQADLDQRWGGRYGAAAIFIGTLRDANDGQPVSSMTLEHYPGMTERQLQRIVAAAVREWAVLEVLVIHRVGTLQPNDPIVLVAVWAERRAAAFAACRLILEQLKSTAPFWKREETAAGTHWVDHNTPG